MLTVAGAAITGFVNLVRLQLGYNPANMTFVSVGYAKDTWAERTTKAAQRAQILWLVLRSNVVVILNGGVAGLLLSFLLRGEFERWAAGSSRNPEIVVGAAAGMVFVAVGACLIPPRRGASIEPYEALRTE